MWEIFQRLCEEKGVTSADVSRATGIGQSTLGNWKKRRNILNAKAAQKIVGHSTSRDVTENIYTHTDDSFLKSEMAKFTIA